MAMNIGSYPLGNRTIPIDMVLGRDGGASATGAASLVAPVTPVGHGAAGGGYALVQLPASLGEMGMSDGLAPFGLAGSLNNGVANGASVGGEDGAMPSASALYVPYAPLTQNGPSDDGAAYSNIAPMAYASSPALANAVPVTGGGAYGTQAPPLAATPMAMTGADLGAGAQVTPDARAAQEMQAAPPVPAEGDPGTGAQAMPASNQPTLNPGDNAEAAAQGAPASAQAAPAQGDGNGNAQPPAQTQPAAASASLPGQSNGQADGGLGVIGELLGEVAKALSGPLSSLLNGLGGLGGPGSPGGHQGGGGGGGSTGGGTPAATNGSTSGTPSSSMNASGGQSTSGTPTADGESDGASVADAGDAGGGDGGGGG